MIGPEILAPYVAIRGFIDTHPRQEVREFLAHAPYPPSHGLHLTPETPETMPAAKQLQHCPEYAMPISKGVVDFIVGLSPFLRWRQTYSKEEVGQHFLNNYGWAMIASPQGPIRVDNAQIMVGYWGAGLNYAMHWHKAEEIYIPIAGGATFHVEGAEGVESRRATVGDCIYHHSNQKHAMDMNYNNEPLLALVLWRGDLELKIALDTSEN